MPCNWNSLLSDGLVVGIERVLGSYKSIFVLSECHRTELGADWAEVHDGGTLSFWSEKMS